MPEIRSINHRHQGILRWLIANPSKTLGECASELGYTQPWLSVIIRSSAFQAELLQLQQTLNQDVALDIKDKLTGLTHLALDKLIETVPVITDSRLVLDVAKETLKGLGYGVQPRGGNTAVQVNINNQPAVTPDELAQARARMAQKESSSATIQTLPAPTEGV